MRLYIAGPMTGLPDFNYPEFMRVEFELQRRGFDISNPAHVDEIHEFDSAYCHFCHTGKKHDWQWYMKRTIKMLMDCDGVALLGGWQDSRGALIEHSLASRLGMPRNPWYRWGDPNAWANLQAQGGDKHTNTVDAAESYERWFGNEVD